MNPEFLAIPIAAWSTALYMRSSAPIGRRRALGGVLAIALVLRFTPAGRWVPSLALLLAFVAIALFGLIARRVGPIRLGGREVSADELMSSADGDDHG